MWSFVARHTSLCFLVAISFLTASTTTTTSAFTPVVPRIIKYYTHLSLSDEKKNEESVFVPLEQPPQEAGDKDEADAKENDDSFEKVEAFGRGSAKAKRGRRKGSSRSDKESSAVTKTTLSPEEVFYEGPPAITETLAPTLSIVTVIGIIPAAAAWARQAWVRYRITTRRIRVNSGIGGKEMAEIVYPDIVEIRTARRLFGDGDLVAFLRDGARFEMRNIPNFEEAMEFVLKQVDPEVAEQYRNQGEVTEQ